MPETALEKLNFSFYPVDEQEFIDVESELRKSVETNQASPPEMVQRFLELLHSKENRDKEFVKAYDDLIDAYLAAIKNATVEYFDKQPAYWFKAIENNVEYSLGAWLDLIFLALRQPQSKQRTAFINFIARSLHSYLGNLQDPPLGKYKILVISGHIAAMFGYLKHPNEYDPAEFSYVNYNAYLYNTLKSVVKFL